MELLKLIAPLLKGILGGKSEDLTSRDSHGCSKMMFVLFWVIAVMGGFFALSGVYEYFNNIYNPVYAKAYMALACFALSIGGSLLYCLINWIISIFKKPKALPAVAHTLEHQAIDMMNIIQTEALQLIKQHPFSAAFIGITVGLLSGTSTFTKK